MGSFIFPNADENYRKAVKSVNGDTTAVKEDMSNLSQDNNTQVIEPKEQPKNEVMAQNNNVPQTDTVTTFKDSSINQLQQDYLNGKIDADEGMKQMVNVVSIVEATADPKLKKSLQNEASKGLKAYMKGISYKNTSAKLQHRHERNEAFYNAFRPVLEFDLSHLIGKKRKKVIERDALTGKKTGYHYEDVNEEPKKYSDRSYGLVLMMVMITLFIIPYCIANVLLAIGRMINALFECFAQFGKTAFYLCSTLAAIGIIGLVVYLILLLVQALFGVQIFV